jgi:hypothetical protein
MLTSSRRGIVYPNPTRVDTADVPRDFLAVINALEIDVIYGQGTLAARPAFGLQGRIYEATDQTPKLFFWDNGAGWDAMGGVAVGTVRGSDGADVQREILQVTSISLPTSSLPEERQRERKLCGLLVRQQARRRQGTMPVSRTLVLQAAYRSRPERFRQGQLQTPRSQARSPTASWRRSPSSGKRMRSGAWSRLSPTRGSLALVR